MEQEKTILFEMLDLLKKEKQMDFSGYRFSMLQRRIKNRSALVGCKNTNEYLTYLKNHSSEFDELVNAFLINVSTFFRDPLLFENIQNDLFYRILSNKINSNDKNLRIWSAGCAQGEEPYSVSIIINEMLKKERDWKQQLKLDIFATDIDENALSRARIGKYEFFQVENVKLGILKNYFNEENEWYLLSDEIKSMVHFSQFDLLNKKSKVPPESIYGSFDVVLCRNVLIYFSEEYQKIIFNKLYKSLKIGGYLILGEAEIPFAGFKYKFNRACDICKIYKKIN